MAMVANNPAKAKELGVPQSVGKDFTTADKGMKFGKGSTKSRADLQKINKPKTRQGANELFNKGGEIMKKGYADGGMSMVNKGGKMVPSFAADGKGKMAKGGMAKPTKKMASGGMAASSMGKVKTSSRADGVATKGKTKGTQIVMAGNKGMKKGGTAKC
jgi:hypothetical protein